jgi:hypothetical protein
MRESTSLNQANGSTLHRLQEAAAKLRSTAASLPPECPVAAAYCDIAVGRSVAPLSISNSPSSRKRVSASH